MRQLLTFLSVLILLVSCGNKSEKFVGKWRDLQTKEELVITTAGDNFLVSVSGESYPASYDKQNNKLVVKDQAQEFDFIIDPNTQYLITAEAKYEKVKD